MTTKKHRRTRANIRVSEAAVHIRSARMASAPGPMPFAIKMAARTRKHEIARQLHTPAVELSEKDRRMLAQHAALESFNVIWRDEMAKLAALRAESETLRQEIAAQRTPTVVTCAKCKQVIKGCPRAHFREKHRGV
jgi:hypothetical protein